MAVFDISVYQPGDPWETIEHFQRAFSGPSYEDVLANAGDSSRASYFEFRKPRVGDDRAVNIATSLDSGTGSFACVVERSLDHGASWQLIACMQGECSQDVQINNLAMYRVTLDSKDAGVTGVKVQVQQQI